MSTIVTNPFPFANYLAPKEVKRHYESGVHFLFDNSIRRGDWISILQLLPMLGGMSRMNFAGFPLSQLQVAHSIGESIQRDDSTKVTKQQWRFWSWRPDLNQPVNSGRASPSQVVNRFRAHLSESTLHLYSLDEIRHLLEISYSPMENFSTETPVQEVKGRRGMCSFFVFKKDIPPLWEDEYNIAGGSWSLMLDKGEDLKSAWIILLKLLTHEKMEPFMEELAGVGISLRSNQRIKLMIWNRDSDNTITKIMLGHTVKSLLNHHGTLRYSSHKHSANKVYHVPTGNTPSRRVHFAPLPITQFTSGGTQPSTSPTSGKKNQRNNNNNNNKNSSRNLLLQMLKVSN